MIHRLFGPSTTTVRWWDRVAYAASLTLLVGVAFYTGHLEARISEAERSYRDRVALTDERFLEDHALLMTINAAKEQRGVTLSDLQARLLRLEHGGRR